MAGPKLAKAVVHTSDRLISDVQARTSAAAQALNNLAIPLDAKIIKNVSVAAASTFALKHTLNRAYTGWFVMRPRLSYGCFIYEVTQNPVLDRTQIPLANDGDACVVDFLVF